MSSQKNDQRLFDLINEMEKKTAHLHCQNHSLSQTLQSRKQKLDSLHERKSSLIQSINILLSRVLELIEKDNKNSRSLINQVENLLGSLPAVFAKPTPEAPQINFTYIVTSPRHLLTLDDRMQVLEHDLAKNRAKREEEIRNIKIRISLAEIQYKELINRQKKI